MTQKNDANRPKAKKEEPKRSTPDSPKQIALYVLFSRYWHICFFCPIRHAHFASMCIAFLPFSACSIYYGIADFE